MFLSPPTLREINTQQKPGNYQVTFNASNYSSGVYYYELSVENFSVTKKMLLLKWTLIEMKRVYFSNQLHFNV